MSIIAYEEDDLRIGTFHLSYGFKVTHQEVKKIIMKYKTEFESLGPVILKEGYYISEDTSPAEKKQLQKIKKSITIAIPNSEKKQDLKIKEKFIFRISNPENKNNLNEKNPPKRGKGRPVVEFYLNEPQATFLTTLFRNNDIVLEFKLFLTKEFFRQRRLLAKLLVQKQNAEWHARRAAGIPERRASTDVIKEFAEYATAQGSESASRYYCNITKMENTALFSLDFVGQKFPNMRDIVSRHGLNMLEASDFLIAKTLKEGMAKQMPYKEIYQFVKTRVEAYAAMMGQTPISMILDKPKEIQTNQETTCIQRQV